MEVSFEELTTIRISKKLRQRLMEMGKKGQSYEDIIWELMGVEK